MWCIQVFYARLLSLYLCDLGKVASTILSVYFTALLLDVLAAYVAECNGTILIHVEYFLTIAEKSTIDRHVFKGIDLLVYVKIKRRSIRCQYYCKKYSRKLRFAYQLRIFVRNNKWLGIRLPSHLKAILYYSHSIVPTGFGVRS